MPKLKLFNHTITMTFILSCTFNIFLFQPRKKKKASQQAKCNPIHLTIEEKTCGRLCEQKINIAALCCANVNTAK